MRLLRIALVFVICVLIAEALAATFSTQFVLHELGRLGVEVSLADRVRATLHDIPGMLPLYGLVIGIGLAIAFVVAGLAARRWPHRRTLLFTAAGGAAIAVALLTMQKSLAIMPIAGARTDAGLAMQALAGAIAGYLFALGSDQLKR